MKFTRSSLLAAVATMLGLGVPAVVGNNPPPLRGRFKPSGPTITRRSRGRRYPEQSSRQAVRGQRRAQGGPGIVLVDKTHTYVAREV